MVEKECLSYTENGFYLRPCMEHRTDQIFSISVSIGERGSERKIEIKLNLNSNNK